MARQGVLGKALENQMGRTALGRDRMPGSMECTCGVAGCVAPGWADWVWVRTGSSSLVSVKPCLSGIDLLMCASCVFSRIQLCNPMKSPLSMKFSRQEYWSGLPFPSPGIKQQSPALQADSLPLSHQGSPKVKVLVAQLCPTFCDSMDCSFLGSSVHVILQEKILEWVAIPFFRGSSQPRDQTSVLHIAGRFFTI